MSKPTLAVIQFPGSNCEYETRRAAEQGGFSASILRWNESPEKLASFDAYILPGGFSYQDRVRSGAIAARLPVIETLIKAAKEGKPVLGICNGCQILAETGLIPDTRKKQHIEVALAPNRVQSKSRGFVCDWVYVKPIKKENSIFTACFEEDEVIPIPVNHGEGRFILKDSIIDDLRSVSKFVYCTPDGHVSPGLPTNPNGSTANIAALTNPAGNVCGIMPHPERAVMCRQIPFWTQNSWSKKRKESTQAGKETAGPWLRLFQSMVLYCKSRHESPVTV